MLALLAHLGPTLSSADLIVEFPPHISNICFWRMAWIETELAAFFELELLGHHRHFTLLHTIRYPPLPLTH
jgi:hypothetical protein